MDDLLSIAESNRKKLNFIKKVNYKMSKELGIEWSELVLKIVDDQTKVLSSIQSHEYNTMQTNIGNGVFKHLTKKDINFTNEILEKNFYAYPKSWYVRYVLPQLLKRVPTVY